MNTPYTPTKTSQKIMHSNHPNLAILQCTDHIPNIDSSIFTIKQSNKSNNSISMTSSLVTHKKHIYHNPQVSHT